MTKGQRSLCSFCGGPAASRQLGGWECHPKLKESGMFRRSRPTTPERAAVCSETRAGPTTSPVRSSPRAALPARRPELRVYAERGSSWMPALLR
jgi:hypothetical protein